MMINSINSASINPVKTRKDFLPLSFKSVAVRPNYGQQYDIFLLQETKESAPPYPMEKLGSTFDNPVKLFFSDIDDTIRRSDTKKIPESALEAIGKLKDSGIPLIYATGRCISELKHIQNELPLKPDFYILEQGTQIIDKDYNIIYEDTMSPKNAKAVVSTYEKLKQEDPNLHLIMYFSGIPYTTSSLEDMPDNKKTLIREVPSFDELLNSNLRPTKIMFYKKDSKSYEELEPLQNSLHDKLACMGLSAVVTSKRYCEVFNKTSSKGRAVKIIADKLGIDLKNTAAIGDSGNDLDMIETVKKGGGVGIAMGNSMDELKENAGYITYDIKDDGFAFAVNQIIENNKRF